MNPEAGMEIVYFTCTEYDRFFRSVSVFTPKHEGPPSREDGVDLSELWGLATFQGANKYDLGLCWGSAVSTFRILMGVVRQRIEYFVGFPQLTA